MTIVGVTKGDTRILDYGSYVLGKYEEGYEDLDIHGNKQGYLGVTRKKYGGIVPLK